MLALLLGVPLGVYTALKRNSLLSQLLLAIPLVALYELGLILARFIGRPAAEEATSAETQPDESR